MLSILSAEERMARLKAAEEHGFVGGNVSGPNIVDDFIP